MIVQFSLCLLELCGDPVGHVHQIYLPGDFPQETIKATRNLSFLVFLILCLWSYHQEPDNRKNEYIRQEHHQGTTTLGSSLCEEMHHALPSFQMCLLETDSRSGQFIPLL